MAPTEISIWNVLSQAMACDKEPIPALDPSARPPYEGTPLLLPHEASIFH